MRVNCSCCLELLTPSDELSSTPCGHVLHTACLLQWLETNRSGTCPQCRAKCKESQLRRVFFSEGMDTSVSEMDADVMQNKMDGMAFTLRCTVLEKKKAEEERDALKAKNVALIDEVRTSERRRQEAKEELLNAKTQMRYVQAEKETHRKVREEAEALRERLRLYESIDVVVKGSLPEVNDRLHEMGDFSKASKELNIIIVALKREMKAQGEDRAALKAEARAKARLVSELKEKLTVASRKVNELVSENRTLASDLRHAEEERSALRKKVNTLQDALDSPSGDARGSVINRMMAEHPAPRMAPIESASEDEKSESPFLRTKSCSIVGLNKRKNLSSPSSPIKDVTNSSQYNIMNKKSRVGLSGSLSQREGLSAACSQSASSSGSGKFREKFYDGMGGHSKLDEFPKGSAGGFKFKPKGVSRPKNSLLSKAVNKDKASAKAIDKYFNFDTP